MDSYGDRWAVLEELGEGGQGKVYLVKDALQGGTRKQQIQRLQTAIGTFSGASTDQAKSEQAESLIHAITQLARAGLPSSAFGALKVLHTPRQANGFEKAKQRMRKEVDALKMIDHPNVIKVLDDNLEENWFVCEYFPSGPLTNHPSLFKGNPLGALTAFRQLVEGVGKLHSSNLIHRDIKPANVFVAEDGRLVLGDLGLVFFNDDSRTRVSEEYENVGSRDWMPGWAYGQGLKLEDIRPAFDFFSLGKLLWVMMSGRTILQLWYHRKDNNKLEKMFPRDDSIPWVNMILDQCIVENEEDCVKDSELLLTIVDDCLAAVRSRAQRIADDIERRCTVCGFGVYQSVIDEKDNPGKFGLRPDIAPTPAFKVFSCDFCGHSQIFHFHAKVRPSAWAKP